MKIKLAFHGAARNVTGSRYLVSTEHTRILVDCGLYQERQLQNRNWDPFPADPRSLDAVVLTHAHVDHVGLLPKLVRDGFAGPVYCTPATAELVRIVLLDTAHIQVEDAEFKKKRHEREGRQSAFPEVPLYNETDALAAIDRLSPVPYEERVHLPQGVDLCLHDAGHILGSSMVQLDIGSNGDRRTLLFSGDIGRRNAPIVHDPSLPEHADYVVMETTYGDRVHQPESHVPEEFARVINETRKRRGNIVVPAFAIERTQDILYYLGRLLEKDRIPHIMVFVDSPMAVNVTDVFRHHPELFDEETQALLKKGEHPCDFPGLTMCKSSEASKAINHIEGTVMILAGSGMCTAGRIKHHLANNIDRKQSTVLFVGYQAAGTLGRIILDGAKEVRIHGQIHKVKARIERIEGFSAHADRQELLAWLSAMPRPPRHVFMTHGEPSSSESFAAFVQQQTGWPASVPDYGQEVELE
jgi:metallo-beta-lactamase family protein